MNLSPSGESLVGAVNRAGDSEAARELAKHVFEILQPEERVLEVAETTATGSVTALCITNKRILLHEGNGRKGAKLTEFSLDGVTRFDFRNFNEITLKVSKFNRFAEYPGLGPRGAARLAHAVKWIRTAREARSSRLPQRKREIAETFKNWQQAKKQVDAHPNWDEATRDIVLNESTQEPYWHHFKN